MRWDLFCRVVDNYGDIGTCWRLARQLADEHGISVRLWVDRLDAFSPLRSTTDVISEQRIDRVEVRHWPSTFPVVDVADVVIEAFACELPSSYIAAMAQRDVAPIWINLEYLSAEFWVEECHLLASPHSHLPLTKYFFFPGFTTKTGGLLRERDLLLARTAFDQSAEAEFWHRLGIPLRIEDELRVSLFCYENKTLPELLQCWSGDPNVVRVMATPGMVTEQIARWFGREIAPGSRLETGSLTVHALPFLPQPQYDQLLWACDVNFVRGEDSFVRAQWAQRPFVWQIYPQSEQTHLIKLDAFLKRYLEGFGQSEVVRCCWNAWNGTGKIDAAWREYVANRQLIQQHGKVWALHLDRAENLANNLTRFVRAR